MTEVVYIGAVGRSGTTLLERTLATAPGVVALGEMVHLWERSLRDDELCGCGTPFSQCEFWSSVGHRAFGGWGELDLDAIDADRRTVDRNRYIPFLIVPRLASSSFRAAHGRLVDVLDRLYEAIAAESAARAAGDPTVGPITLVDSSKHPSYLFLLRALPQRRVRLLHTVRDPRGVANSWARTVARPESGEPMERLGLFSAWARWTSHNLLFQLAGVMGVQRTRLAYERFTHDPPALGRAVDRIIDRPEPLRLDIDGASVRLGTDHTVSGNPMRFQAGSVTIRPDEGWRRDMPRRRRIVMGMLTTPMRQVYAR